jgi:hypothetical protein
MTKSKIALWALADSLGTVVYTAIVATIMQNGNAVFGKMNTLWGPIAFLMLFVLSATVAGSLVLGRPVLLYFEGKKKEAVLLFIFTVGFMALFTLALLTGLALAKA